jgi:FKBP-type peptidyl-prolyl cis-trans isomerase SlyD
MSLVVSNNSVVSVHYKLTDDQGNLIDSSEGSKPMAYLHGAGNIISGLERALEGKGEGESLKVRVEPAEGYGEVNPEGIKTIDKAAFQGVESVEPGMAFEAQTPNGAKQQIVVKKVEGDSVTIDLNHPLAGVALNFDVQVVGVREATEEERTHGHAH